MRAFLLGIIFALATAVLAALIVPAPARDLDGRYAQSLHRDWVRGLKDKTGMPCCDSADGTEVEQWDIADGRYRVLVNGKWIEVPDKALLTLKNRLGFARAWIYLEEGILKVRCFLPGMLG